MYVSATCVGSHRDQKRASYAIQHPLTLFCFSFRGFVTGCHYSSVFEQWFTFDEFVWLNKTHTHVFVLACVIWMMLQCNILLPLTLLIHNYPLAICPCCSGKPYFSFLLPYSILFCVYFINLLSFLLLIDTLFLLHFRHLTSINAAIYLFAHNSNSTHM